MKCFMHPSKEAISVCKKCGKAMCADCSSYTGHSGICPVCKKEEYETELKMQNNKFRKNTSSTILWSIVGILITILAIILIVKSSPIFAIGFAFTIAAIIKVIINMNNRKSIKQRIIYLQGEIQKINTALSKGTGII